MAKKTKKTKVVTEDVGSSKYRMIDECDNVHSNDVSLAGIRNDAVNLLRDDDSVEVLYIYECVGVMRRREPIPVDIVFVPAA